LTSFVVGYIPRWFTCPQTVTHAGRNLESNSILFGRKPNVLVTATPSSHPLLCVEMKKQRSSSLSAAAAATADEKPQQTEAARTQSRSQSQSAASASRTSSSSSSSSCLTNAQCRNGGTCFASKCICRPGYQGSNCAQRQWL